MKKLLFVVFLLISAVYVSAQNPIIIQGESAITNIAGSSTATSSDSIEIGPANTYVKINGEYDWSIQLVPLQYGVLTSDSVYATVKLFVSNKDNDDNWSEIKKQVADITAASPTPVVGSYFQYRDTLANTTVALSPGLVLSGQDFQYKRMKLGIDRPKTTDSVGYKVIYVLKLHQDQSR